MPRIAIALGAGVLIGAISPALASDEKQKETCAVTAGIVSQAVAERAGGADVNAVKDGFMTGDSAVAEKYQPTVGPLVDWVYTLEAEVIAEDGAAETIGATYEKSCLGYDP